MLRANDDNFMNAWHSPCIVKQNVNIMLLVDPGDSITTSTNDEGIMHGPTVTLELSIFCFIFQLLNTLKECLLSFLTVTILMFRIAQEGELSSNQSMKWLEMWFLNRSCIFVTLFGAAKTIHLCVLLTKLISPIGWYETVLITGASTNMHFLCNSYWIFFTPVAIAQSIDVTWEHIFPSPAMQSQWGAKIFPLHLAMKHEMRDL